MYLLFGGKFKNLIVASHLFIICEFFIFKEKIDKLKFIRD